MNLPLEEDYYEDESCWPEDFCCSENNDVIGMLEQLNLRLAKHNLCLHLMDTGSSDDVYVTLEPRVSEVPPDEVLHPTP